MAKGSMGAGQAVRGLLNSLTIYAAVCFSSGSLAVLFRFRLGLDAYSAFLLGAFVAVGPVYVYFASGWGMRRALEQIRQWERDDLIDPAEATRLRKRALDWFAAKRFGK